MCNPIDPASCAIDTVQMTLKALASAAPSAAHAFAASVIKTTIGWWVGVPSMTPASFGISATGGIVRWIAIIILTLGLAVSFIKVIATSRIDPVISIAKGIGIWFVTASIAVTIISTSMLIVDWLSATILNGASSGQVADRLVTVLASPLLPPAFIPLFAVTAGMTSLGQAGIMLFRDAGIAVLTVLLILVSAGQTIEEARPWYSRTIRWIAALIFVKLAVAICYSIGLSLAGSSKDARGTMVGLFIIIVSVFSFPLLLRLFGWMSAAVAVRVTGGSSSGSATGVAVNRKVERERQASGEAAAARAHTVTSRSSRPASSNSWQRRRSPAPPARDRTSPDQSPDFTAPGMLLVPQSRRRADS
jgi:uncharacterized membrane protein